jgi:hypothetical protein
MPFFALFVDRAKLYRCREVTFPVYVKVDDDLSKRPTCGKMRRDKNALIREE